MLEKEWSMFRLFVISLTLFPLWNLPVNLGYNRLKKGKTEKEECRTGEITYI